MNAYVEVPLFDLGCAGLWRTGRPTQEAQEFDPQRIARYVEGYSSVRPLSDNERAGAARVLAGPRRADRREAASAASSTTVQSAVSSGWRGTSTR